MSNSFSILTLSGFLLVTILGFSTAHAVQFINESGSFNSGKCLIVSAENSTPVKSAPCDATFAQEWNWEGLFIQGIGTSFERRGGKCLEVSEGGTADGTPVQLFDCNLTGAQQWIYFRGAIQNMGSGKCLDVFDDPGVTQARIRTCDGSVGQRWRIR